MAFTIDFRRLDEGFGGKTYKRKRAEQQLNHLIDDNDVAGSGSMDVDITETAAKRQAVPSSENPNKPDAEVSLKGTTFEQRAMQKELKKAYKERMTELKETIRMNKVIVGRVSGRNWKQPRTHRSSAAKVSLEQRAMYKELKKAYKELKETIRMDKVEKRKKEEEREKKKQENNIRTGTRYLKITNPKTLKKIAKSKVPDNLLNAFGRIDMGN